jgi:hypothetical protein
MAILLAPKILHGHWSMPEPVPVDRLVANLSDYIKAHPDDPEGYYVLARAHSLAFTLRATTLNYYPSRGNDRAKPPTVPDESFQGTHDDRISAGKKAPVGPTSEKLRLHLRESVSNYRKAIALAPQQAHYHLGLAYVMEQGLPLATELKAFPPPAGQASAKNRPGDAALKAVMNKLGDPSAEAREEAHRQLLAQAKDAVPLLYDFIHTEHRFDDLTGTIERRAQEIIRTYWLELSIAEYLQAYQLAIQGDLKLEQQPLRGLGVLTSYESGTAYLRLVRARGIRENERSTFKKIDQDIYSLEHKPPNRAITPIIFSVDADQPMSALLDQGRRVVFDLDGDGDAELWPWVKPTTGFLVWDPERTGRVASGRQMFGSVTWWMFFEDGYHALDALDDNRDGELAGDELTGLAAWFDRNSNGRSEPGEVAPLCELGILSLSARATEETVGCPANPQGLRLKSGKILPTYDWIATSVTPVNRAVR